MMAILFAAIIPAGAATLGITSKPWGKTADGIEVTLYKLTNGRGMEVDIMTYGGIITRWLTPDRHGELGDIALGYDNLDGYLANVNNPYFGALVGRYANRIAKGTFHIDGSTYRLPINNGPNCLHGGTVGFDKKVWTVHKAEPGKLELSLTSPDGDQGFPGTLHVTVTYTLTAENTLRIDYTATTDKDTVINLTSHTYFNLDGAGNPTILPTILTIDADHFTAINKDLIPTGVKPVEGTPLDFREPTEIGARIGSNDTQVERANGYDHNWVLNHKPGELAFAARAFDPRSGRILELYTTQPGVQLYTGNFLNGKNIGKGGLAYPFRCAFCLETQHYPDSPNHPSFPSTALKPGQTYHQVAEFHCGVRE